MNTRELYYVYSDGILGVKTNTTAFKWIYGSTASEVSVEEYEVCRLKFDVCIVPEKRLTQPLSCDKRFQAFTWCEKTQTISYRRKLFRYLQAGYNIRISGNTVFAEIGENYFRFVRFRLMHLHGIYYLLSDLANILLLKNGYLTLYASAVYSASMQRSVVCFAPPNTGKTLTATKLCDLFDYELVGEDIVISDGQKIYACPWTCSYRKESTRMDHVGSFRRVDNIPKRKIRAQCDLTDLVVLSLGKERISVDKQEIENQICTLNGYLFQYYSSPIVKVLGYFDAEYCKPWEREVETMLKRMVQKTNCQFVQSEQPMDFYEVIRFKTSGN